MCPSGETTLILGANQMALQIHESVGHATELDRILGWEAAFAGTSWLDLAQLGSLRFGSPLMNVIADASLPGALGSFGFDDEGTPAHRVDIVKDGIWVGVLSGRDSAALVGIPSGGCVRADGFNRLPMVRMTNIGLLPGDSSLEEMIADTDDGIYMDTNRSWSIDDQRLNFQFGCEIAYEIKNGKRRADAAQPDLHRHQPDVLGLDGPGRRPGRMGGLGHAQLRQGPTDADRAHRPPDGAVQVPERPGGGDRVTEQQLDLADRVVTMCDGGASAEVTVRTGQRADPVRQLLHPPERRGDASRRSHSGCPTTVATRARPRPTVRRHRCPSSTTPCARWSAVRLRPPGCDPWTRSGPAWPSRRRPPSPGPSTSAQPTPRRGTGRHSYGTSSAQQAISRRPATARRSAGWWPSPTQPASGPAADHEATLDGVARTPRHRRSGRGRTANVG